jgi:hypothetical protein
MDLEPVIQHHQSEGWNPQVTHQLLVYAGDLNILDGRKTWKLL